MHLHDRGRGMRGANAAGFRATFYLHAKSNALGVAFCVKVYFIPMCRLMKCVEDFTF